MRHSAFVLAILALLSVAACASHVNTPSGYPEVTINADQHDVAGALAARMVDEGYVPVSETSYCLVFEREVDNVAAQFFYGFMVGDTKPIGRITYTLTPQAGQTRVVCRLAIVYYDDDAVGKESTHDSSVGKSAYKYQAILEELKQNLENRS